MKSLTLFALLGFLLVAAIMLGMWTLIAAGMIYGLQALGVVEFSWTASMGIGLILAFISGLFDRKRQ